MDDTSTPWSYFVSYAHTRGFGSLRIRTAEQVTTFDAVQEFRNTIARSGPLLAVDIIVLNFVLLSGPRPELVAAGPHRAEEA